MMKKREEKHFYDIFSTHLLPSFLPLNTSRIYKSLQRLHILVSNINILNTEKNQTKEGIHQKQTN